ncbi:hypothetical protein [Streptomyces sp. NPDC094472]|uniref:hypothetical protein n=1 Tax=Streptomyces sp. NPDC094472 TaxID=3155080 RepID=UPI00332ACDBD
MAARTRPAIGLLGGMTGWGGRSRRRAGEFCGRGGGSGVFPATAVVQHNASVAQELRGRGTHTVLRSAEP